MHIYSLITLAWCSYSCCRVLFLGHKLSLSLHRAFVGVLIKLQRAWCNDTDAVRCLLCSFQTDSKAHPGSIHLHAAPTLRNCGAILSLKKVAFPWNFKAQFLSLLNLLTPNDEYSGRTAPLTSKCFILYIYSTNICTEYFKHGIYSPAFPLQNAVCFINITYLVPVLFTFYIQCVLKLKKK